MKRQKKNRLPSWIAVGVVVACAILYRYGVFSPETEIPPEGFEKAEVVYVVDGDTIDVQQGENRFRVRLLGIDCEESVSHQTEKNTERGREEAEYTRTLLPKGTVVYLQKDQEEMDQYQRQLRYVWLELPEDITDKEEVRNKMVNGILLDQNQARVKWYDPNTLYMETFWSIYEGTH